MPTRLFTARTPLAQALRCALFGGLLAGPALLLASPAGAQTPASLPTSSICYWPRMPG